MNKKEETKKVRVQARVVMHEDTRREKGEAFMIDEKRLEDVKDIVNVGRDIQERLAKKVQKEKEQEIESTKEKTIR